jgi:hypothetical protein
LEEIDIWRTAKQLIDEHGLYAEYRAMIRASELNAAGDTDGAAIWGRIFHAIEELRRMVLSEGEFRH